MVHKLFIKLEFILTYVTNLQEKLYINIILAISKT